jgi:hypothetical protein
MNAKSLIASVSLLLAAGAAFAAPAAQVTREQVIAETVAARDAGQLDQNEASLDQAFLARATPSTGGLTRAQVIAETIAARNAGELDINDAYMDPAFQSPRKSAYVKAQLAAKSAKGNTAQ